MLSQDQYYWSLRYVMLLWLSLICMLPFDLSQFDEEDQAGRTAAQIEEIAKSNLSRAGVERDAAAILLARLYTRYIELFLIIVLFLFVQEGHGTAICNIPAVVLIRCPRTQWAIHCKSKQLA